MTNYTGTMSNMHSYCNSSAAAASVRLAIVMDTALLVVSILLAIGLRLLVTM